MKVVLIVIDGAADYPCEELGGRTPLEVAEHPNIDEVARRGTVGLVRTIPDNMDPDSDVAHMSILGYDPLICHPGRSYIEAKDLGLSVGDGDLTFRANLVYVEDGNLVDYSAGSISDEEAKELVRDLNECLSKEFPNARIHHAKQYRCILLIKNHGFKDLGVKLYQPHNHQGEPISKIMPRSERPEAEPLATYLRRIMVSSRDLLEGHRVNAKRTAMGLRPANMVWLWGMGRKTDIMSIYEKYELKSLFISEVPLIRGLGKLLGADALDSTGLSKNRDLLARLVVSVLENYDLILLHFEEPDEASHAGDLEGKIKSIEECDRAVGRVMDALSEGVCLAVLPDHPTPVSLRVHVKDPVPFAILGLGGEGASRFTERDVASASKGRVLDGCLLNYIVSELGGERKRRRP